MKATLELIIQKCVQETLCIGLRSIKTWNNWLNLMKFAKKCSQEHPWLTFEMDFFTLDGYSFLLVVDVTSRFPVVYKLSNETCSSVVNALKVVYCDFG